MLGAPGQGGDSFVMKLEDLGWSESFSLAEMQEGHVPARVLAAQRERYRLLAVDGAFDAVLSGKLRHEALEGGLPVVGDWVAASLRADGATIHACLPRRSSLIRKRAGRASAPQVLAANLDVVFVVTSLNADLNPRRIERTLAMIWEGGAQPVVLLSKLDLCREVEASVRAVEAVALGVPVHALSALSGAGLDVLERYLKPGRTLALIGSSGVGKSTLANALLGAERIATAEVRAHDDKGKHTTTARELFVLESGALLIDTPGMRELGLWDAEGGLDAAFDDIEALAAQCRFGDCRHAREPGCAIREAIAHGELEAARLGSYEKLQRELAHEARRHDPQQLAAHNAQLRTVFKARTRAWRNNPKR
jgi:ribosome biogenesis GTPase